jgi:plasmid stabilization system protein ParE
VSRRFQFHPEARLELRQAVQFYEGETRGLGADFRAEVRAAIEHVLEHPLSGSPAEAETRRKLLVRFPYSLVYLPRPHPFTIIAVMHHRRRPGYWLDRVTGA